MFSERQQLIDKIIADMFRINKNFSPSAAIDNEKIITLYTAKDVKYRQSLKGAKDIPVNLWLTTSVHRGIGYGLDFKRDIWEVNIKYKYLWRIPQIPALDYVTFSPEGNQTIPCEGIYLYYAYNSTPTTGDEAATIEGYEGPDD